MSRIPVGLQLYTLRDETKADFLGTLKKVADMGYETVEFAGYGGIAAGDMKKALDELGLQAVSSHVGLDALTGQLEQQIEYSRAIGAQYIVCPWLDAKKLRDAAQFEELMANFRRIGEVCKANGLMFGYHNHAFEFEKIDGQYILDRMYQAVSPDLMIAELDLFWVQKGGENPCDYLQQYTGRTPLIHVKDMANDEERSFAEVGHGIIDYKSIFEVSSDAGVQHYIVEQDVCKRPPLESVKMSIDYLKSIGIA